MLGIILMILLAGLGIFLLADTVYYKLCCTLPVEAFVSTAAQQPVLNDHGSAKREKFPRYRFTLDGSEHYVTDYNAGKRGHSGDHLVLYCHPQKPDRCWYVAGRLWPDLVYGALSLAGAVLLAFLYLL